MLGQYPLGGVAFDYLQYVSGLAALGHDVYYYEDTWSWPYDPRNNTFTDDGMYSASAIETFLSEFVPERQPRWHYVHLREKQYGMDAAEFARVAQSADLYLNVSGASFIPQGLAPRCRTVFIDTDPGYNQVVLTERFDWVENVDRWCSVVYEHDAHFTFAENINGEECIVPQAGLSWRTTRGPIDVALWRATPEAAAGRPWTTVMSWHLYEDPVVYKGVEYGDKSVEFKRLIDIPSAASVRLMIAIGGSDPPVRDLQDAGWTVLDGPSLTRSPESYRNFIAGSRGELSAAKNIYVAMRTGWFSGRSACYLAAGRPVIVQDTGFSVALPVGAGLVAFDTAEEALTSLEIVEADYTLHAEAARSIAADYFDAGRVLKQLLEDIYSST